MWVQNAQLFIKLDFVKVYVGIESLTVCEYSYALTN